MVATPPAACTRTTGMLVRPEFYLPRNSGDRVSGLACKLGLDPDARPRGWCMFGGHGSRAMQG